MEKNSHVTKKPYLKPCHIHYYYYYYYVYLYIPNYGTIYTPYISCYNEAIPYMLLILLCIFIYTQLWHDLHTIIPDTPFVIH